MELNYSLTENDYLQQQLYLASKSKQIKKQRKISVIVVMIIVFISGLRLFYRNDFSSLLTFGVTFLISLWVCFFWQKKYYRNVFEKYVVSNFKSRIGTNSKVLFNENGFEVLNEGIGEYRINFSNFKNISEIKDYFFIAFKTGESFMIPKDKIEDVEELRNKLKSIAENLKIDFISELDWKWK